VSVNVALGKHDGHGRAGGHSARTLDPTERRRLAHLRVLLPRLHGAPGAVLHELDLVAVRAGVEDVHEEPAGREHKLGRANAPGPRV